MREDSEREREREREREKEREREDRGDKENTQNPRSLIPKPALPLDCRLQCFGLAMLVYHKLYDDY